MSLIESDIPLRYKNNSLLKQAENLCDLFSLELATRQHTGWVLDLDETQLSLQHSDNKQHLAIHFDEGRNDHRRRFSSGRQQPLSKAVGLDKPRKLHILDATAGFGRDSFVFASLGAKVSLVERHPVMAALLYNAIERAKLNIELESIMQNMTLLHKSSDVYLLSLLEDDCPDIIYPDVIYIDPMYPERKKSALVKKDMQAAHAIVGADEDSDKLLDVAMKVATKRVVVKRPKGAEHIAGMTPSTSVQSKNTRYDIYTNNKLD